MSNEINYTYDHTGTRTVKSHGPMEAVYVNGAPQGINYHDEENYTVYVSPYLIATADRFTKYYYNGTQRIASKLGTGEFDNVYGVNNFHLTAGQKDYAERMVQIEESRQEYMKQNGIPPGVPTQKGQNIEPEITGVALPNAPLGNYDVPDGWPTKPHFNEKGDVPGPPLQWEEPEDLGNVEAGYGFVPDNTEENDIFFFHSDHLGSTSYLTDKDGNACEFVCYMPYGEALVNENNTDFENLFKFSGMELDKETGLYNHGARLRDPITANWLKIDPLYEKFPDVSPMSYCHANPVGRIDMDGKADFYARNGTYLGNDGVDNGDIYLLNEGYRAKTENESINWGGNLGKYVPIIQERSEKVDGLIIQNRIEQGADYTISEFHTIGCHNNTNGYMLEPAGPSTKESGIDKRIPEGVYDLAPHNGTKYKNTFVLYNEDVPKSRAILYHVGNYGKNTEGCNLSGTEKGNGAVYGSSQKFKELLIFIKSQEGTNIKTIINNNIEE